MKGIRGFTLIEGMIAVALIALLAMAGIPYTISWFHEADVRQASNILQSAYGRAKSVALRNPAAVQGVSTPSAGMRAWGDVILVCHGNPAGVDCTLDADGHPAANVIWQATVPPGTTLHVNGLAMSSHGINNAGQCIACTGQSIDCSGQTINHNSAHYKASKGSRCDDGQLR